MIGECSPRIHGPSVVDHSKTLGGLIERPIFIIAHIDHFLTFSVMVLVIRATPGDHAAP